MEHFLLLFVVTFLATFIVTIPPGLLNVNAAKTSVEKNKLNGIIFSLGVSTIVLFQAATGVFVSKFLDNNPGIIAILLKVSIVVFSALAIYFFAAARRNKKRKVRLKKMRKRSSYYKGMLLALVNFLAVPFYSGINIMWKAYGWILFNTLDTLIFLLAAGCGTFAALYFYVLYFNRVEHKTHTFARNANYLLSFVMLVLLVINIIRINS